MLLPIRLTIVVFLNLHLLANNTLSFRVHYLLSNHIQYENKRIDVILQLRKHRSSLIYSFCKIEIVLKTKIQFFFF